MKKKPLQDEDVQRELALAGEMSDAIADRLPINPDDEDSRRIGIMLAAHLMSRYLCVEPEPAYRDKLLKAAISLIKRVVKEYVAEVNRLDDGAP